MIEVGYGSDQGQFYMQIVDLFLILFVVREMFGLDVGLVISNEKNIETQTLPILSRVSCLRQYFVESLFQIVIFTLVDG